jgi:hypothetical protein
MPMIAHCTARAQWRGTNENGVIGQGRPGGVRVRSKKVPGAVQDIGAPNSED